MIKCMFLSLKTWCIFLDLKAHFHKQIIKHYQRYNEIQTYSYCLLIYNYRNMKFTSCVKIKNCHFWRCKIKFHRQSFVYHDWQFLIEKIIIIRIDSFPFLVILRKYSQHGLCFELYWNNMFKPSQDGSDPDHLPSAWHVTLDALAGGTIYPGSQSAVHTVPYL